MKRIFFISGILVLFLSSCLLQKKEVSSTQGWNYNDPETVGFEVHQLDYKLSKNARKRLKGLVYIPGGSFTSGHMTRLNATERDSTLLIRTGAQRVTISGFYMSNHEVTNAEYRRFVDWVKRKRVSKILCDFLPEKYPRVNGKIPVDMEIDLEGVEEQMVLDKEGYYLPEHERYYHRKQMDTRELFYMLNYQDKEMKISVYPDTNVWIENYYYGMPTQTNNYFWHPAYDSYPVVGVSYYQALAYCQWLSDRINEEILLEEKIIEQRSWDFNSFDFLCDSSGHFSEMILPPLELPSEYQWERAALYFDESEDNERRLSWNTFPWMGTKLTDADGKYRANFGIIFDQNDYMVKPLQEMPHPKRNKKNLYMDVYENTAPVFSFEPNNAGLYQMAGNVAEWTSTRPTAQLSYIEAYPPDDYYVLNHYRTQRYNPENKQTDSVYLYNLEDGVLELVKRDSEYYFELIRLGDSILKATHVQYGDTYEEAKAKMIRRIPPYSNKSREAVIRDSSYYKMELDIKTKEAMHNARVLHYSNPARIVKGGSWASGPGYLQCSNREVYKEDKGHSTVGFRVIMQTNGPIFK